MTARVEIFTDGACSGNPGVGGWGAILRYKDIEKELSGGEENTTNNRMELMAVIMALSALKTKCNISLYTDSKYVMNGITEWLAVKGHNGHPENERCDALARGEVVKIKEEKIADKA